MTRFRAIVPMYALSAVMGLLISAVVTWVQLGPVPDFLAHWWRAAALSIAVMLPSGGLVMVGVSMLVRRMLAEQPVLLQRSVMALGMGLAMEAVASAMSTINNLGLQDFWVHWAHAYWRAVPLALVIGPFMAFVVRPWIERRLAQVEPTAVGAV